MATEQAAKRTLANNKENLLAIDGVISVGLTLADDGGFAIIVGTLGSVALPRQIDGVPVILDIQRNIPRLLGYTARYRPVPVGASIGTAGYWFQNPWTGNRYGGPVVGSAGVFVKAGGKQYMITSGHLWWFAVLERWDKLSPEAMAEAPLPDLAGLPCLQPGFPDGGKDSDIIGRLTKYTWGPVSDSKADGSLVEMTANITSSLETVTVNGFGDARLGDNVTKVGRTTGITRGKVVQISSKQIFSNPLEGYNAMLEDCLILSTPSVGGDSGGPVLNDRGQVIGLVSGGNGGRTICTRISNVLSALKIEGQVISPGIMRIPFVPVAALLAAGFAATSHLRQ